MTIHWKRIILLFVRHYKPIQSVADNGHIVHYYGIFTMSSINSVLLTYSICHALEQIFYQINKFIVGRGLYSVIFWNRKCYIVADWMGFVVTSYAVSICYRGYALDHCARICNLFLLLSTHFWCLHLILAPKNFSSFQEELTVVLRNLRETCFIFITWTTRSFRVYLKCEI